MASIGRSLFWPSQATLIQRFKPSLTVSLLNYHFSIDAKSKYNSEHSPSHPRVISGISINSKHFLLQKRFNSQSNNDNDNTSDPVFAKRGSKLKKKLTSYGVTELPKESNMVWPKVTLFGDSITRLSFDVTNGCWGAMLANKLGDYFDIDVRGFSGYNTRWALELVPKLFPKSYLEEVAIFVVFFGHNDSWEPTSPLHIPLDEYEKNMKGIVKHLLDNGVSRQKIILITPTWYHLPSLLTFLTDSGWPETKKELEDAAKYADVVVRLANSERLEYVDAFGFSKDYQPLEELFFDGIHYSTKGAQLLFERLWPVIERKISHNFKKPVLELFHAPPCTEIPQVRDAIEAHIRATQSK